MGLRVTVFNEIDGRTTDLLFNVFPIRVGRNKMNDLVLNHQYVSQWHAIIGLEQRRLTITQVGSSNSLMIGERRLRPNEEIELSGNEKIRITPFGLQIQLVALPGQAKPQSVVRTPSAVSPAIGSPATQTSLEQTALQGLDHLSRSFLGRPLQTAEDVTSFTNNLEQTLSVFFRFFVALQMGQDQFKKALDIKALGSGRDNPVERVKDGNELSALLLAKESSASITELEHAFKNIMLHQVALINGLMAGVRTLLAKLSPKSIAKEAATEHRFINPKTLWPTYERIHRDLAEEDNETFETIFGKQFSKAYSDLVGQKAGRKDDRQK